MHKYILLFGMSLAVGCDPPMSDVDLQPVSHAHLSHVHHEEDERRGCGEEDTAVLDTGEVY